MKLFVLALMLVFFSCRKSTTEPEKIKIGFLVTAVKIAIGQPCDYVFIYGEDGLIGTVFVGDSDSLYGHFGEKLTAQWRARCSDNTTARRDTVLTDSMHWTIR
jgi:hypothetical protein